jgi:uncharacterized RDD family membrane protein YckC
MNIEKPKVGVGVRLGSMILDHLFMSIISMIFFVPGLVSLITKTIRNVDQGIGKDFDFFGGYLWLALIGLSLYYCKDSFNGRSLAKRIIGLQIIDSKTGEVASPLKCFARNLFMIIWPVEVIFVIIDPSRRLGDKLAGTSVVYYDPSRAKSKPKGGHLLIAFALAYALNFILVLPALAVQSIIRAQAPEYVQSSYNDVLTVETEQLLTDSLGNYMNVSAHVYDQAIDRPKGYKYIVLECDLIENYLEHDSDFQELQNMVKNTLYTKFPKYTFSGEAKFTFREGMNYKMRSVSIDDERSPL